MQRGEVDAQILIDRIIEMHDRVMKVWKERGLNALRGEYLVAINHDNPRGFHSRHGILQVRMFEHVEASNKELWGIVSDQDDPHGPGNLPRYQKFKYGALYLMREAEAGNPEFGAPHSLASASVGAGLSSIDTG